MKKVYVFCISIIQITFCSAQITITNHQVIQPNDSVYASYLDTTGFNAGNSGANVIWDYSSIPVIEFNANMNTYLPTSNSVCFSDTVNMYKPFSFYSLPAYRYDYYFVDSTQLTYKGYCLNDPSWNIGSQTYTDPPLLMSLPLNYLESFTDSSVGVEQGGPTIVIWKTEETITKHYDAYGELRLPWVTLPNTARLQTSFYIKDSIINSAPGGGEVRIFSNVGYEWYDLDTHGPVLQYADITTTYIPFIGVPTTTFDKIFYALGNSIITIKENYFTQSNFKISPNPFSQSTQITLPQTYHNIALAVYDIQGKQVAQHQYKDCSQIQLNRNQLSNGLYFLKLMLNDKEVETGKIVVRE